MRKFIKYEIRGNYKFILGILALVIIASSIIQGLIYSNTMSSDYSGDGGLFTGMMSLMSILVIFGALLVAFINIVGSFRKELYEDRGYLTFTLPLTGNQILGSKLIVAFLWYSILTVVTTLYNVILATILFDIEWSSFVDLLGQFGGASAVTVFYRLLIMAVISGLVGIIFTLIFVYLSMAIGKVSLKNIKIGGLWFIIFLITFSIVNVVIGKIAAEFPLYLNLETLRVSNIELPVTEPILHGSMSLSMIIMDISSSMSLNLTTEILNIIVGVLGFISTGYLLDRKIDL